MTGDLLEKKPARGQTIKDFVGSMVEGFNNIGRKITKADPHDNSRRSINPHEWNMSSKSSRESIEDDIDDSEIMNNIINLEGIGEKKIPRSIIDPNSILKTSWNVVMMLLIVF